MRSNHMPPTLIFDCDGVLSDTGRYGHLPAYNQMFREFGLPIQWSVEEYGEKLRICGGKERMASLLTDDFVRAAGLPIERASQMAEVARWYKRKTEIYTQMVAAGLLPPRPGIRRIITEALEAGWRLAVASTSAPVSVAAVLNAVAGRETARRFAGVFAGDIVPKKKPAPDVYIHALEQLGAAADKCLAIEDSENGVKAAVAAGLACIVTVNAYTEQEDFAQARLVLSSLGDPGELPISVLANRSRARPGAFVSLQDLQACLLDMHG
jgi:HAD superfamily hydrolase (TIGR01509 family)